MYCNSHILSAYKNIHTKIINNHNYLCEYYSFLFLGADHSSIKGDYEFICDENIFFVLSKSMLFCLSCRRFVFGKTHNPPHPWLLTGHPLNRYGYYTIFIRNRLLDKLRSC